ncbi:hypothetical protein [Pseudomonas sp.]|nr:hypothetical protein [Pseudomonas sp.]
MSSVTPLLYQPAALGNLTLPNRIIMASLHQPKPSPTENNPLDCR